MFGFGKSTGHSVALIDISSGSVAGAYVYFPPHKLPVLLFSIRAQVEKKVAGELGMLRTLDTVVHALQSSAGDLRTHTGSGSVERVFVTLSESWLSTQIKTTVEKKEESFVITESYIQNLLKTEEVKGTLTSHVLLSTLLNGYLVENPVGKRVREAECTVLTTRIKKELNDLLTKSLRRIAQDISVIPHTSLLREFAGQAFPQQKDFITLLVSEENAEVGMVKRGVLLKTAVLLEGTETFARAARGGGFSSYAEGGTLIDTSRNERLAKAITEAEHTWLVSFVETLKTLVEHQALPQTVFLIADLNSRDFMKRLLDADEIKQLWLSGEHATVVPLLPQHLTPLIHLEPDVDADIVLEALALYAKTSLKAI